MIYVITHKKFDNSIIPDHGYKILHVGPNDDCGETYLRDDIGDNIAHKNSSFCELTGLYWIWKNGDEADNDIVGINHYRRYFTSESEDLKYKYFNQMPAVTSYEKLAELLNDSDIILPKPMNMIRTVGEFYCQNHLPEDMDLTRKAIAEITPEYVDSFDEVMESHKMYFGNMFVCRRAYMDVYCKWLFEIMTVLERTIDLNKYDSEFQKRVFGFIGERLLQVWTVHNKLRVAELPVFNTEKKSITVFENNYNRIKYGIIEKMKKKQE